MKATTSVVLSICLLVSGCGGCDDASHTRDQNRINEERAKVQEQTLQKTLPNGATNIRYVGGDGWFTFEWNKDIYLYHFSGRDSVMTKIGVATD